MSVTTYQSQHQNIETKQEEREEKNRQDHVPPNSTKYTHTSENAYSVFTLAQKKWIVFLLTLFAFFSPFSSTVYLPALLPVQQELKITTTQVNLSLTTYLIFQAIAPTLSGELSDTLGRRPVYLLTFIVYVGACAGLAVQKSLAALLILRMLQSSGNSGTVAIAFGTLADFTTPAERGSYMGFMNSFPLSSPALGPVIGGAIAKSAGWRWIFWFLVIFSSLALILMFFAFPETNRKVVGDGSIRPPVLNRAILEKLVSPKESWALRSEYASARRKRTLKDMVPNPLRSILIIFNKDVSIILLVMSIFYAAFYAVMASLPKLFSEIYGYNELQIGLCYLAFGTGGIISSIVTGKIIDRDFQTVEKKAGIKFDRRKLENVGEFPLEEARLKSIWYAMGLCIAAIIPYGWALSRKPHVVVPLVLQFIIGASNVSVISIISVFLVDLYPTAPATATASGNLCRCMFGAISTSFIEIMITKLGVGWTFTIWGTACCICFPLLMIERRWGYKWRLARFEDLVKKKEQERPQNEASTTA
ncbi:hypothetical protein TWF970_002213 [Orbilia oligospora]|uniref:Major facilitator superfamily (MFS) profile domain-containing protein n=1 Tax=Orbilia oligospora TaxID=2813651 RepID=A0A7C8RFY0_ORBOL|nr:hypothetical protein TWF970_002213 [Orbilia oligospora]